MNVGPVCLAFKLAGDPAREKDGINRRSCPVANFQIRAIPIDIDRSLNRLLSPKK